MNIFEQLTEDVAYCTQALGCTNEQTDELIQAAGTLGINACLLYTSDAADE